jgi:DNA-binding NarL/FixJ family response regulator
MPASARSAEPSRAERPAGAADRLTIAIIIADAARANQIRSALARLEPIRLAPDGAEEGVDLVIADSDPGPDQRAIALTPEPESAFSWEAELRGVLPQTAGPGLLRAVVEVVAAGLSVGPGDWFRGSVFPQTQLEATGAVEIDLTDREHQVLELLASGETNKAIARRLGIAPATAKFHVSAVLAKLGAHSRSEAAAIALRRGLIML